jgi:hypothetical protein
MNDLDENTALSILFSNTRRKNRTTDLMTIAKTCDYLIDIYGSKKELAKKIDLSQEMIREFLLVKKLAPEIQEMIHSRIIDSVDVVKQIAELKTPDEQKVAAQLFLNSDTKDIRDIKRLIKNPNMSLYDAKNIISEAIPKGFHIFLLDLDDNTYKILIKEAKNQKEKPADLIKKIIWQWMQKKTME